jgi:hypothetical protein
LTQIKWNSASPSGRGAATTLNSTGHLRQRELVLDRLQDLPFSVVAEDAEVLHFIDRHALSGFGIGHVDAHLLAAVRLTPAARFWTRDKRLSDAARHLDLAAQF